MGFSIYDEILIFLIILYYFVNEKISIKKNNFTFFLIILLGYIIFHSIFFYRFNFSILDNLRYFRFLGVILISISVFLFIKDKKINYNEALNFCFIFFLFLIFYSFYGDLLYRNFSYLRIPGEKNPINLFYDTGGSGKFIIQNFVISGSRNFSILVLISIYFVFKSTIDLRKKIIFLTSIIFLSVYNDSNACIYLMYISFIILIFKDLKFLKILIPSVIINYVLIVILFVSIHLVIPWKSTNFVLQNANVTIKYILKQISIVPVDHLISYKTKSIKAKIDHKENIDNLKIDRSLLKYLETNNIFTIKELLNECSRSESLQRLSESVKRELCSRAELLKDANERNIRVEKFLDKSVRLNVEVPIEQVKDSIKIKKGDYYLIDGLEMTINNHALAEAITHFVGVFDKDRDMINIFFGSGINSHRSLLPISISKLLIEYKDSDKQDKMIKQNLYNTSFSSYTLPSLIFELGFIIIFFILFLILSSHNFKNINIFFFLKIILLSFFINFNDAIIFYLMLLFFIRNDEKA